jgi:hypothetical protein
MVLKRPDHSPRLAEIRVISLSMFRADRAQAMQDTGAVGPSQSGPAQGMIDTIKLNAAFKTSLWAIRLQKGSCPGACGKLLRRVDMEQQCGGETAGQLDRAVIVAGLSRVRQPGRFWPGSKASPAPDSGESGHDKRSLPSSRRPRGMKTLLWPVVLRHFWVKGRSTLGKGEARAQC